ncbi:MAG: histidine phosphatase family protein [Planctomycetota bacterium]|nr:histidine phosphatase family protein [Planctomycetota bacterium]
MTRQLLLMRHAKSDWNGPGLGDKDRPLNARGKSTAPTIATWLFEHGLLPDLILCSSAVRTLQTLSLMMEQWESLRLTNPTLFLPKTRIEDKLYLASDSDILSLACSVANDSPIGDTYSLMVLGHNPGMEILASNLSETSIEMPTGAIAVLASNAAGNDWPQDWQHAKMWSLRGLVKPRELGRETN